MVSFNKATVLSLNGTVWKVAANSQHKKKKKKTEKLKAGSRIGQDAVEDKCNGKNKNCEKMESDAKQAEQREMKKETLVNIC